MHIIIASFFITWFFATIINQFNYDWVSKIRERDILHLLPRWTFFAPNPGTSDYHILFRQMDNDNNVSEFYEFPIHGRKHFFSFLWNPKKRVKKTILDLSVDFSRLLNLEKINEDNIKLSFTYLVFLNFFSSIKKDPDTKYIQFAVVVTKGYIQYEAPYLLICSEFHHV
ncbi:hypothetical protein BH09BAC6_BH09BAC6_08750 [soil metagenome]|jgi:hypothetical protein